MDEEFYRDLREQVSCFLQEMENMPGNMDLLTVTVESCRKADVVRVANYMRSMGLYCKILSQFNPPTGSPLKQWVVGAKLTPF